MALESIFCTSNDKKLFVDVGLAKANPNLVINLEIKIRIELGNGIKLK